MKKSDNQHDNSPIEYWASYWNLTAEQLKTIISKIESRDFIKIQNYIQLKLSRGGGHTLSRNSNGTTEN